MKVRSVTFRSQEMKRRGTPWQKKVDEYCRSYLEAYPEICRLLAQLPESVDPRLLSGDLRSFVQSRGPIKEVFKQLEEVSQQRPELCKTKSIRLKAEFVQMVEEVLSFKGLVAVGENEYPARFAEILELMQKLALFPGLTPEMRMASYFLLAFYYTALNDLFGTMRRRQYGAEPLDATKIFALAGQFFEMLAYACRGRPMQNKGRYNLELIGLVKMIQEHQTKKMSPGEMREALAAAGVSVPEGETWRIWLWRARKDGLIPGGSAVPTAHSKKPE